MRGHLMQTVALLSRLIIVTQLCHFSDPRYDALPLSLSLDSERLRGFDVFQNVYTSPSPSANLIFPSEPL